MSFWHFGCHGASPPLISIRSVYSSNSIIRLIDCMYLLLSPCEKHLYSMNLLDISQPVKVGTLASIFMQG